MGALTSVGNAPSLTIYAIAVERGVRTPNFFGRPAWLVAVLVPILALKRWPFFIRS